MDTKQFEQRVVASGATVEDRKNEGASAAESVARRMDWRLGNVRMDENSTSGENNSDLDSLLDDEGLLQITETNGTLVVSGDLDLHQAPEFRRVAEMHIDSHASPRLDLTQVPFLDSAGLATLLALSRIAREQNKSLRVLVTGSPRRVLRITGIDRVLLMED
ncbi:MAG: STAS domain-containing protein [Armatimonadota bacterium]